jgi:branched-chain amino acid transport system ATP-binding protein
VSERDTLLSVEGVRAGYGLTTVLRGVDLSVDRGSVVALVGRNGVGKTTTLRSIIGNVVPSGGTISFDDEEITELDTVETIQRGIAFVPENRRVFPGLTVRENIEMGHLGTDVSGGPSVDEVLDTFENLEQQEHSEGSVLSGGEQQMLAIARALVADPDLLLLDEPTEGLAPYIVRQIEEIVADLNDDGITVLLVEQNIPVALDVAEYVYILEKGQIVHHGTTDALRDNEDVLDRHLGVGGVE